MGFASWKTADTKESIANAFSARFAEKPIYLLQPNDKQPIREDEYQGYCRFSGVNALAWLAKENAGEKVEHLDIYDDTEELISIGLEYLDSEDTAYPLKFSYNRDAKYELLCASEMCEFQGYFYPED